jgi:hypothetical protein
VGDQVDLPIGKEKTKQSSLHEGKRQPKETVRRKSTHFNVPKKQEEMSIQTNGSKFSAKKLSRR